VVATERPMPSLEYVMACPAFSFSPALRVVAENAKLLIAQKPDLEAYYSAAERLIQWNFDHLSVSETII
jgi:hypothetical protein